MYRKKKKYFFINCIGKKNGTTKIDTLKNILPGHSKFQHNLQDSSGRTNERLHIWVLTLITSAIFQSVAANIFEEVTLE